mmetsp:Transcript_7784/g.29145  ORF Transcript_7784/g.29145 Transcript_7784/m.29145 type:complete len:81 (+) Transcript_7784:4132-4374(+)
MANSFFEKPANCSLCTSSSSCEILQEGHSIEKAEKMGSTDEHCPKVLNHLMESRSARSPCSRSHQLGVGHFTSRISDAGC